MALTNPDWRRVGSIVGVVVLIWLIAGIILAGNGPPPPPGMQPLTLRGGHVTGTRISSKSWVFEYKRAEISADGTLATLDGVRNGILYRNGSPYLSLTAEHASVNTHTFDFTATGDVHVAELHQSGSVQRSFDTDLIQWVNAAKLLTLPHPSMVRGGGETLKVTSITVNFNTGQIRLGGIEGGLAP